MGLLEDPGVAKDAPGDHHPVCPGVAEDAGGVLAGEHVPVGDDGDGEGLLDLPNVVPIGGAGVHLHLGPAVEGDGGHPHGFQHLGQVQADDVPLVPAQAHLHGDGGAPGPADHRLGHPAGLVQVPQQAGAVPVVGHFGHGAAHVDVDDVRVGHLPDDGSPLLHAGQVAAEDLHPAGVLLRAQLHEGEGLFILIAQGFGADHLGDGVGRPQLPADGAEGQVGDPRHGGQHQGRGDMDRTDPQVGSPQFIQYLKP